MKTKIKLDIHRPSVLLAPIAMLIADHNGGIQDVDPSDIVGLVKSKKADFPNACKDIYVSISGENRTMIIYECAQQMGTDINILTLSWNEVYELNDKALYEISTF